MRPPASSSAYASSAFTSRRVGSSSRRSSGSRSSRALSEWNSSSPSTGGSSRKPSTRSPGSSAGHASRSSSASSPLSPPCDELWFMARPPRRAGRVDGGGAPSRPARGGGPCAGMVPLHGDLRRRLGGAHRRPEGEGRAARGGAAQHPRGLPGGAEEGQRADALRRDLRRRPAPAGEAAPREHRGLREGRAPRPRRGGARGARRDRELPPEPRGRGDHAPLGGGGGGRDRRLEA